MTRNEIAITASAAGFVMGLLAGHYVLDRFLPIGPSTRQGVATRPEATNTDPPTVRLEPLPAQGDSREATLVMESHGKTLQTWRLSGIFGDEWSDVPVNEMSMGSTRAWWVSWRTGTGTGLGCADGVVVWLAEHGAPAFWSDTWRHAESFSGPDAYDYEYSTQVLLRPGDANPVRLLVEVRGEVPVEGKIFARFVCEPRRLSDSSWRFLADGSGRRDIQRLLKIDRLRGIHKTLLTFLNAPPAEPPALTQYQSSTTASPRLTD